MLVVKLKGRVTPDRRLVVRLPRSISPGSVQVIVLATRATPPPRRKGRGKVDHPGFGIWARRAQASNPARFAAVLRRRIERRDDRRA